VHELSLCQAIARIATEHSGGQHVSCVHVRIGYLRQVVPDSLQFCWGIVAGAGPLEACVLDIEQVPAVVTCNACGARSTLDGPILVCGSCASTDTVLLSGDEFLVLSIDVVEVT
jgi:hydrogenase nickel incorporation protein HypA/HybF